MRNIWLGLTHASKVCVLEARQFSHGHVFFGRGRKSCKRRTEELGAVYILICLQVFDLRMLSHFCCQGLLLSSFTFCLFIWMINADNDDHLACLSILVSSSDRWDRHIMCKVSLSSWLCSPECSAFNEGVGWPPVPKRG